MNWNGTLATAALRAAYNAAGTFLATFLVALATTSATTKEASIAAGIAALATLGFRGGVEGLVDRSRQQAGDVKQSDVQPGAAGKA